MKSAASELERRSRVDQRGGEIQQVLARQFHLEAFVAGTVGQKGAHCQAFKQSVQRNGQSKEFAPNDEFVSY
jgi:hypothetical protein